MNIAQIEENVKSLLANLASGQCTQDDFIYELLLAYGHRKQSVSRLRSGERNLAIKGKGASVETSHNEIIWKRHLYYKQVEGNALLSEIDQMRKEKLVSTNKIRFIIVTDFDHLFAHDLKTNDRLDISLSELPNKFDFFLPWAGMEKAVYQGENPADVKAAEKMAKLFDLIKDDNFDETNKDDTEALHGLNVFLTRLLFCFFAEDTEIFKDNQFSNAIQSHTKDDGSDLSDYLNRLFLVLNTADSERSQLPNAPLPDYLDNFPYVNGGLFADDIPSPTFSAKSRRMLIECGSQLDWSDINPDIFGSMIQAVVHPDQRGGMGMHYTSVTNIMKVIEPLFLNDLYEELEKSENSATKLQKLQQRLGEIKIFDPACGSGNFLIIAYKELRKLEMEVLKRLQEIELEKSGQISQPFSVIKLSQFYGIELDDFAHEVAILSLWLAEHQMNVEFKAEFGESRAALPLHNSGGILCGNAVRVEWGSVCDRGGEVYIIGNPPYKGARKQSPEQKQDLEFIFNGNVDYKDSDYVVCWLKKASSYICGKNVKFAFVTTDSIYQGEQVSFAWESIYENNQEIFFGYESFEWKNNAKDSAGVFCIIAGVRSIENKGIKTIYSDKSLKEVVGITPYIKEATESVFIRKKGKPISKNLPKMVSGSMARDGGYLFLSKSEVASLLKNFPVAKEIIRPVYGTSEFMSGKERFCIWVDSDEKLEVALSIPLIKERIYAVKKFREQSSAKTTRGYAIIPHMFAQRAHIDTHHIIIPKVSTDKREYMPLGFMPESAIITDLAFGIYNADLFTFGILSSKMHNIWHKTISGRLGRGPRYSSTITYNNFPIPEYNSEEKNIVEKYALEVLSAREMFPEKTISELYDPDLMPDELRLAHSALDKGVDTLYSTNYIKFDYERLDVLFSLYKKMTGGLNA